MQPMSVTLPLELFRLPSKAPPCSSAPTAVPAAAVAGPQGTAAVTVPAAAAGPGVNGDISHISAPNSTCNVPLPTMNEHSRSMFDQASKMVTHCRTEAGLKSSSGDAAGMGVASAAKRPTPEPISCWPAAEPPPAKRQANGAADGVAAAPCSTAATPPWRQPAAPARAGAAGGSGSSNPASWQPAGGGGPASWQQQPGGPASGQVQMWPPPGGQLSCAAPAHGHLPYAPHYASDPVAMNAAAGRAGVEQPTTQLQLNLQYGHSASHTPQRPAMPAAQQQQQQPQPAPNVGLQVPWRPVQPRPLAVQLPWRPALTLQPQQPSPRVQPQAFPFPGQPQPLIQRPQGIRRPGIQPPAFRTPPPQSPRHTGQTLRPQHMRPGIAKPRPAAGGRSAPVPAKGRGTPRPVKSSAAAAAKCMPVSQAATNEPAASGVVAKSPICTAAKPGQSNPPAAPLAAATAAAAASAPQLIAPPRFSGYPAPPQRPVKPGEPPVAASAPMTLKEWVARNERPQQGGPLAGHGNALPSPLTGASHWHASSNPCRAVRNTACCNLLGKCA